MRYSSRTNEIKLDKTEHRKLADALQILTDVARVAPLDSRVNALAFAAREAVERVYAMGTVIDLEEPADATKRTAAVA
jgi:hypothetical protein